ncbi:MAG: hypothetical protein GX359_03735 [Clostridiales bacterium]|nr:hypothetical protein [Clostridiales bacterium]
MLFLLVAILVFIIFIQIINRKNKINLALNTVLIMYFLAIISRILYLSKDIYYYNLVKEYIYLPASLWRWLTFLDIHRFWVIRFLNWSSLGIVWSSINFAFTMNNFNFISPKIINYIKTSATVYVIISFIIFDPYTNLHMYYFLYPDYMSPADFSIMTINITHITQFININLLIISVLIHFVTWVRLPKIRYIRYIYLLMMFSFSFLGMFYIMFLSDTPAYFLKISKLSRIYTYSSLNMVDKLKYYKLFPYILIIILVFITYGIYKITTIHQQLIKTDFEIYKQISASDTTSKVFCHYFKNELLAIQSELEIIKNNSELQVLSNSLHPIIDRCKHLYSRLDSIHRSTKTSELHLKKCNLVSIINQSLNQLCNELKDYTVKQEFNSDYIPILGDPFYLEQAFLNIIQNSLDAMENLPSDRKNLIIKIQNLEQWNVIEISDTGIGITQNNIQNIFTPFFSSHPISNHWGIGLTLVYKLIRAHEGKIEIESIYQNGTTVRILLPNINIMKTLERQIN